MCLKTKKTYNINLLYKRFQYIYNSECDYNEGDFTENDLNIVFKLITFFQIHASSKEKRDILSILNKEW